MKAVANKTDTTPSKILVYDRIQLRAQYVQCSNQMFGILL